MLNENRWEFQTKKPSQDFSVQRMSTCNSWRQTGPVTVISVGLLHKWREKKVHARSLSLSPFHNSFLVFEICLMFCSLSRCSGMGRTSSRCIFLWFFQIPAFLNKYWICTCYIIMSCHSVNACLDQRVLDSLFLAHVISREPVRQCVCLQQPSQTATPEDVVEGHKGRSTSNFQLPLKNRQTDWLTLDGTVIESPQAEIITTLIKVLFQ